MVKQLLAVDGVDVNSKGETALLLAARNRHKVVVELLQPRSGLFYNILF